MILFRTLPSLSGLVSVGVLVAACSGPGVVTPMPEPLSLDPSQVGQGGVFVASGEHTSPVTFTGSRGASVPGALLRVTNLDRADATIVTTARSDGSFTVSIVVGEGEELRFQAISGTRRLAPVDVRYDARARLQPVTRLTCLELDPGYELNLGSGPSAAALGITNSCSGSVQVDNPRQRLSLPEFALISALPASISPGERAVIAVNFAPSTPGEREDILFLDVRATNGSFRYPFTLLGGTP